MDVERRGLFSQSSPESSVLAIQTFLMMVVAWNMVITVPTSLDFAFV